MSRPIFAQLFALADDNEQAEWLNTAGRLWTACGPLMDVQACRVVDKLDKHGRALVECLYKFIELDGKN